MGKKAKPTHNPQNARVGKISDAEREAAGRAYARHCEICKRYGITPELFERFTSEHVEASRTQPLDEGVGAERFYPARDYRVYYVGKDGGGDA